MYFFLQNFHFCSLLNLIFFLNIFHVSSHKRSKVVCSPVKPGINWKQLLFSFKGRINRKYFWIYSVCSTLLYIGLCVFFILPDLINGVSEPNSVYFIIMIPISAIKFFWMDHAVIVKRLHDIDMSAWNLILLYLPIIVYIFGMIGYVIQIETDSTFLVFIIVSIVLSICFGLVISFRKGNPEPNKYGNPPK